jgi:hypothetical protein
MSEKKQYDAFNMGLDVLQPCTATNNILGFSTTALQVTEQNFATLTIHFDSDIYLNTGTNQHYFTICAKRGDFYRDLTLSVGDWIVLVRGEILTFPDSLFRHAFTTDELIEYRCSVCGKISGDNQVGDYKEKHVAYLITVGGQPMHSGLEDCNMKLKV